MEERIIISTEHTRIYGAKFFTILFLIMTIVAVAFGIAHTLMYDLVVEPYYDAIDDLEEEIEELREEYYWSSYYEADEIWKKITHNEEQIKSVKKQLRRNTLANFCFDIEEYYLPISAIVAAVSLAISLVLWFFILWLRKTKMVVTNKRIYGYNGRTRVDLPLSAITAFSIGFPLSVTASTASGVIRVPFVRNRYEVHGAISALLLGTVGEHEPVVEEIDI